MTTARAIRRLADDIKRRRPDLSPTVLAKSASRRYSLHALYQPMTRDYHGDIVDEDQLFDATVRFVRDSSPERAIYLNHSPQRAGEWVGILALPADFATTLNVPGLPPRQTILRKGSVLVGVCWEPWAFELVEKGEVRGLSLGGMARRKRRPPTEG